MDVREHAEEIGRHGGQESSVPEHLLLHLAALLRLERQRGRGTGEPIGLGRLLARPTATLSLEAQQRREMKQKMFGD